MSQAKFSLSQETITIVTVGVALAGIMFVGQGDMRAEGRAHRAQMDAAMEAFRAEGRAHRARIDALLDELRTEARADRDELRAEARADREAFAQQITRLFEQQGNLSGLVEGLGLAIGASGR